MRSVRMVVLAVMIIALLLAWVAPVLGGPVVMNSARVGAGGFILRQGTMQAQTAAGSRLWSLNATTGVMAGTPATTTGAAWTLDANATLTTGSLLQLVADDDVLTTGKYVSFLGGSDHATSVFAISKGGALASTGEITGTGPKHYISVPLGLTANTTTITGVLVAHRAMTITKASIAFATKPASAAGTITLALADYDLSATADDNLISTATVDLEALTAKTASDLTLTATAADLVLADGDFVYATIVSNNADATGGGGVLTIEYTLQ